MGCTLHGGSGLADDERGTAATLCEQIVSRSAEGSAEELGALLWRATQIMELLGAACVQQFVQGVVTLQATAYQQELGTALVDIAPTVALASVQPHYEWVLGRLQALNEVLPVHWDVPFAVFQQVQCSVLCCVVLCCVVLCCVVLCCVVLCCVVSCRVVWCGVLCCAGAGRGGAGWCRVVLWGGIGCSGVGCGGRAWRHVVWWGGVGWGGTEEEEEEEEPQPGFRVQRASCVTQPRPT